MSVVRLLLAFAWASTLTTCTAGPAAKRSPILTIAIYEEPISLNPLYLNGFAASMIEALTFSYLTNYDARGRIVADVATAVPTLANGGISADGMRITYHLRDDVRWQDGAPLTSRDVAFTYRAVMNPSNAVPLRYPYDLVDSVETPGPYTAIVKLNHRYSPIITSFLGGDSNYPILPAHLLAKYASLDHVAFNGAPIGSGPYRFTKWARGDRLELTSNDRYYAGKPAIHRISLRVVPDYSTTVAELATREVDVVFQAAATKIAALRRISDHQIVVTPVPHFAVISFNVTDPIVKDVAVRRAFALAIDRHALTNKVYHGMYNPDTGMRGLFSWAFDPHAGSVPYDPLRAQMLLARDGWALGADGIRTKGARRMELQLSFSTTTSTESVSLIAAEERAVGIEVTAKRYGGNELLARDGPLSQGRFQVAWLVFQSAIDPDASWLLSCPERGPNGVNFARYCNAAVDRALQHGAFVFDRAARRRAYSFVQRQLIADMPYDFLCQLNEIDVIPSSLKGFEGALPSPFTSAARWRWSSRAPRQR